MLCKNCAKFDTAPGIKWGICDCRRQTTDNVNSLIKGPDTVCSTPQFAVKKEGTNDATEH